MLNEEVPKYRRLSGDNNENTPISRIGGFLDGYEIGRADGIADFMLTLLLTNNWSDEEIKILTNAQLIAEQMIGAEE